MKVLYFHQHFSTPKGSTGTRSYEMARHLIHQGHQVTMVCGSYATGKTGLSNSYKRGKRCGIVDGIDVIELELAYDNHDGLMKRTLTFLKFAVRSIHIALTMEYDILFATSTPLTAGIPGIFARWLRKKPFVFEVRDLWPDLPKALGMTNPFLLQGMRGLEWLSYHSANRLIGLSPGIVDGIASRGISKTRIIMISNGCDLSLFNDNILPERPDGIDAHDFLAIYTGTHGIANGLLSILDAAYVLKQRGCHHIKIVLVGDGKLKKILIQSALEEQLNNIIFLDSQSKEDIAKLMRAADLGLQILENIPAFYYGTSPNKFFDYIASGLPVLTNYPGWLSNIIEANKCGLSVTPKDPFAFADALEYASHHRENLKVMGINARELAKTKFNRDLMGKQFVTWLEGAVLNQQMELENNT